MKTTLISLSLLTLPVAPLSAVLLSFDFTALVNGSGTIFDGYEITGTVKYDDSLINPAVPTEFYGDQPTSEFELTARAFGQTFTDDDDADFSILPNLTFFPVIFGSSQQFGLTFVVSEKSATNSVEIDREGIEYIEVFVGPSTVGESSYAGIAVVGPPTIPEPSAVAFLSSALLMAWRRRRA